MLLYTYNVYTVQCPRDDQPYVEYYIVEVLEQGVLCHSEDKDARSCGEFQYVNVSRCHAKELTIEVTAKNIVNRSTPVRGKPYICTQCLAIVTMYMHVTLCWDLVL